VPNQLGLGDRRRTLGGLRKDKGSRSQVTIVPGKDLCEGDYYAFKNSAGLNGRDVWAAKWGGKVFKKVFGMRIAVKLGGRKGEGITYPRARGGKGKKNHSKISQKNQLSLAETERRKKSGQKQGAEGPEDNRLCRWES